MKIIFAAVKAVFVLYMAFSFSVLNAQAQDEASVKSLIESKRFVFKVQTIMPLSGTVRQSLNEYDIRLYGDSLISQLPYFGRAFTAPMPGERGGFYFTSTDFDYSIKNRKKGGWEILLKPKDVRDVREYFISVSEKGYANLRVISNSRQPISYSGVIAPLK
jgi:hypothetical protein